ncbi:Zn-ribbon domain-containing OB-fold protein [Mycobacterium sp. 2YAF39]|uniref:Zn-ribbon domain-containing OB-fold protein n=1 Tax=Mycobacterium sp. 2YAF39 TaxID=3233033 RepID=UPI003F9C5006
MTDNGLQLDAQRAAVPHATPGLLTAPFWMGCAEHRLLFQRCGTCSAAGFPPTEQCRQCLSTELSWEASAGRGVVYSWTVVHRAATPVFQTPYAPAIVTLDEGYQMLTNIIDADIEEVRVGMVVQVDFREVVDDLWLPYFQPVR